MRALVYGRFGGADELQLRELPVPVPSHGELVVKVSVTDGLQFRRAKRERVGGERAQGQMVLTKRPNFGFSGIGGSRLTFGDLATGADRIGHDPIGNVEAFVFGPIPLSWHFDITRQTSGPRPRVSGST